MSKKIWEKRRYQERIVENFTKWKDTASKLATIVLPTGCGKTASMAMCLDNALGSKILWVAHREELIDQAYNTLSSIVSWTNNIQKEMAEHKADPLSDIIVGSVQTIARNRKHLVSFEPDIIVIDEYHHCSENNKTYKGLFDRWPKAKVLGLTATPWRFNGDDLPLGEVLFEMDIGTAIAHKYLVPAKPEILKSNTSLANVKTQMGDFAMKELSETVNVEERNKLISNRIIELVKEEGRQGILFGVDVVHSHDMFEILKKEIRVAEVYGETPKEQRRYLMEKIRNGEIDCLCNNLVCTEGFDVPHLSFAGIARPTRSLGLFCQMAGRVLRTSPNKSDAIILDIYDKLKIKQSRITFSDMADKGDMFGEKKKANNILTADIEWNPDAPGAGSVGPKPDHVAKILKNFPVFMIKEDQDRWTTDDHFMPITSWVISSDQRLITWTEEKFVDTITERTTWQPIKAKPTKSLIKTMPIHVIHSKYGEGKIVDIGFGLEVKVEFESDGWISGRKEFVPFDSLKVKHTLQEVVKDQQKKKIDRIFYLFFPKCVNKGRLVELTKVKKDLIAVKDERMTKQEATKYIVDTARTSNIFHLVRSDAQWKKAPISPSQRQLLENWMLGGKIRFDLDLNSINKGDASAIIEQVKWQSVINEKFGAGSKEKLISYDPSVEDV